MTASTSTTPSISITTSNSNHPGVSVASTPTSSLAVSGDPPATPTTPSTRSRNVKRLNFDRTVLIFRPKDLSDTDALRKRIHKYHANFATKLKGNQISEHDLHFLTGDGTDDLSYPTSSTTPTRAPHQGAMFAGSDLLLPHDSKTEKTSSTTTDDASTKESAKSEVIMIPNFRVIPSYYTRGGRVCDGGATAAVKYDQENKVKSNVHAKQTNGGDVSREGTSESQTPQRKRRRRRRSYSYNNTFDASLNGSEDNGGEDEGANSDDTEHLRRSKRLRQSSHIQTPATETEQETESKDMTSELVSTFAFIKPDFKRPRHYIRYEIPEYNMSLEYDLTEDDKRFMKQNQIRLSELEFEAIMAVMSRLSIAHTSTLSVASVMDTCILCNITLSEGDCFAVLRHFRKNLMLKSKEHTLEELDSKSLETLSNLQPGIFVENRRSERVLEMEDEYQRMFKLRQDLERLRILLEVVRKREVLKTKGVRVERELLKRKYKVS